ncbi:MAG: TIGR02281 family clan AA aspartic protease [Aquabacterium sp.]
MGGDFPRTLKIATVWLLAGLLVFLGYQALERHEQASRFDSDGRTITLRRGPDGHYHWPGRLNGVAVDFLVDTGATRTALPQALADQAGLARLGEVRSETAGGIARGWAARADLALDGGVRVQGLPVVVLPGLREHPLLGMDVLGRMRWRQESGVLTIEPGR